MAGRDIAVLKEKAFLPKPYCPTKLVEILRQCLDGATD
jgi:hypothetical protein